MLGIFRKPKGARTDKLKCCTTNCYKIPVIGGEYLASDQRGGIYGTIYKQYHGAKTDSQTIAIIGITRLLDYAGRYNTDAVYHGYAGDGTNYVWLDRGSDVITFHINGWTHVDGWVEYTK